MARYIDGDRLLEWLDDLEARGRVINMPDIRFIVSELAKECWVSVNDGLPEQHDTVFAKLKGTDKWKDGLFEKMSDDVRVVIKWPSGKRTVSHSYMVDGQWACETLPPEGRKVTHWMPNPDLPKEENDDEDAQS